MLSIKMYWTYKSVLFNHCY